MRIRTGRKAEENAAKIAACMNAQAGSADLYRTVEAGPSGQRADELVGRVHYRAAGPYDFEVVDPRDGGRVGYARRTPRGEWSMTDERAYDGALSWLGYASSLAVGVDVMVNGQHTALGRHNSRRISSGSIRKGQE